jgi:hypothetical protein
VFASVLGFTAADADELRALLLDAAQNEEAVPTEHDVYGQRYVLDVVVTRSTGQATVRSTWIVLTSEDFPRLTSCYIL